MFRLPVVATHWRGIQDIVQDGVTGRLVPIEDAAALGAALETLLSTKECALRTEKPAETLPRTFHTGPLRASHRERITRSGEDVT